MLNDDLICAYLDGELDQEKRALVEHRLAGDKGAAARLERMRGADALIRRALPRFASDAHDPIAALIMERPLNVVKLVGRTWAPRAAAIAAACVIGILVGRLSGPERASDIDPQMRLGTGIERVLENTPSGQSAPIMGGEVHMALSVQTEAGAFCRQFRVTSGPHAADGLACREGGQWRLVVQAAAAREAAAYNTAGSEASPVEAAINAMGGAMVLDENEERALIAADWRR